MLSHRATPGHRSGGGEGPSMKPGLFGSQALRHPGTTWSCRKTENGVGALRLDLAGGQRGKRGAPAGPVGKVLWFVVGWLDLGGGCGWDYGRLDGCSVGEGFLHCSPHQIPMRRG